MKFFASILLSLLLSASAFSQTGVYLFGYMYNAPGTPIDITVVVYSTPPVTAQFTVNPDGSISNTQNNWVDLPSFEWTHFEVIYPTCDNATNILTVDADTLPNMIDVFYTIDYCASGSEVFGCTNPNAINYNPQATIDDGSCTYIDDCVGVDTDDYCVDINSPEYFMVIQEDVFCCNNAWDQICQDFYENIGGLPLPGCDDEEVFGCTDPVAFNYDPEATNDDGSCVYDGQCVNVLITLSGDSSSQGFWEIYNQNDQVASGTYAGGEMTYGVCLQQGCDVFNYVSTSGDFSGPVYFSMTVAGDIIVEAFFSQPTNQIPFGIYSDCDDFVYGCTDPNAINFNAEATVDDGSCEYETDCTPITMIIDGPSEGQGTWDLFQNNGPYIQSGSYSGSDETYDLCLLDGCYDLYFVMSNGGVIGDPVVYSIYQGDSLTEFGTFYDQTNMGEFGVNTDCDSTNVVYGCTDPNAINYNPNANVNDGSCYYNEVGNDLCADASELQLGTQLISNVGALNNENIWGECWAFGSGEGEQTSIWYSFTTPDEPATIHIEASGDGTYSLTDTQFGLFEECGGEMIYCDGNAGQGLFSAFHFNCGDLEENTTYILMIDGYFGDNGTCNLTYDVSTSCDILGCTDPEAINYNPEATADDGSCEYEADCTNVSISFNSITANQVFWDLYNDNAYVTGNVYSGGPMTFNVCLEDGCYDLLFLMGNPTLIDTVAYSVAVADSVVSNGILTQQTTQISFGVNSVCEDPILGCTDPEAINYNPDATVDDGSCEYAPCEDNEVLVIIDTQIWGYEISWNILQDSIVVASGNGYQDNTAFTHLECLEDGCYTFEMFDTFGDGWNGGVFSIQLDGVILASGTLESGNYGTINFGINADDCGENEIYGCTDPNAINYDPNATIDNGSCEYEEDCTDVTFSFNSITTIQGFFNIYSGNEYVTGGLYPGGGFSYTTCLEDGCYNMLFSMAFDGVIDTVAYNISIGDSVITEGIVTQPTNNQISFGLNADCEEDIWGCTDPIAINYDPNATIEDGSCEYAPCEDNEVLVVMDTQLWGNEISWNILQDGAVIASQQEFESEATTTYPVCLEDGCYTFEMFDSFGDGWNGGTFTIILNGAVLAEGTLEQGQYGTIDFGVNEGGCGEAEIYGCTDPAANNYNPEATIDDGSCEYDGNCVEVGDEFCVDINSQAYFITITQDSFCCTTQWDQICQDAYIEYGGPIGEDCEIYGCTDPNAINYNVNATIDDGSCEYQFDCAISFTVSPDTTGAQVIWITPSTNIANATEVEWDFGDGTTSNDLFPIHTYEGDGPYTLCLTAYFAEPNGGFCEITYCAVLTDEMINPPGMQTSGFSINVLNPNLSTGLDEVEQLTGLNLWPNPASEQANIEFTLQEGTNVNMEVFDIAGKTVVTDNFFGSTGSNFHPIDVSDLQPGMYLVRLTGDSAQLTTRMVIR